MKKILVPLLVCNLTIQTMNPPVVIHETEEVTLTFKNILLQKKSLVDGALECASFKKENTFTIGELVVINNGLLSVLNISSKVNKKIVRISDINGSDHTFEVISKTDEHGNPKVKREITIKDAEMFGKIPQSLAESLQISHH